MADNKLNVQVGSKVWIDPSGYSRSPKEPFEATVTKVGRKYFFVDSLKYGREVRYNLETGREESNSNYLDTAYSSLQEIFDKKERDGLIVKLSSIFRNYTLPYTLEQLREINRIIETKI